MTLKQANKVLPLEYTVIILADNPIDTAIFEVESITKTDVDAYLAEQDMLNNIYGDAEVTDIDYNDITKRIVVTAKR